MRKINVDRLLDMIIEEFDSTSDYCKSSAIYYKNHGHGVSIDRAFTKEERHIAYAYHADDRERTVSRTAFEILGLNIDQIGRAYNAARAVKRWYNRTNWERLLPHDLIDRIENYIYG